MLEYVKNADGMYYPKEFFPRKELSRLRLLMRELRDFQRILTGFEVLWNESIWTKTLLIGKKNFLNNITTMMLEHLKCFQNAIFLEAEKCGIELSDADRKKYLVKWIACKMIITVQKFLKFQKKRLW